VREGWNYQPSSGPLQWPSLYPTCKGSSQSPIDIVDSQTTSSDPGPIKLGGYDISMQGKLANTDHTITFSYNFGSTPFIYGGRLPAGDRYLFSQFHFHWGSVSTRGSEHTLSGKTYPAEIHFVHYNSKYGNTTAAVSKSDGLAVLGFFFEVSSVDNGNFAQLFTVLNQIAQTPARAISVPVPASLRLDMMLPSTGLPDSYYYYPGSLTTPSCDESVLWTVFPTTIPISEKQLNQLRTMYSAEGDLISDNVRPVQPLNSRIVYKRTPASTAVSSETVGVALVSGSVFGTAVGAILMAIALQLVNLFVQTRASARTAEDDIFNWGLAPKF